MDKRIWVGLSTTKTFLAWIIRAVTKQKASHAWVSFFDESLGQRMVIEASVVGYRILPWNAWLKDNPGLKTWVFITADHNLEYGLRLVSMQLGSDYDIKFFLWQAWKRWFKHLWKHPGNSPNKIACSEACVRIIQKSNIPDSIALDPEVISPGDLLNYLTHSVYFSEIDVTQHCS